MACQSRPARVIVQMVGSRVDLLARDLERLVTASNWVREEPGEVGAATKEKKNLHCEREAWTLKIVWKSVN